MLNFAGESMVLIIKMPTLKHLIFNVMSNSFQLFILRQSVEGSFFFFSQLLQDNV